MLEGTGLARAGFTTRRGGVSTGPYRSLNLSPAVGDEAEVVRANRLRLAAWLGMDPARLVEAEQVHGKAVAVVGRPGSGPRRAGPIRGVDGLATAERGLWLAVYAADCVPVLVLDPDAAAAAAVHAGWRGTATGIVPAALRAMRRAFGTDPRRALVALGPAIGGCCYEVDAPVAGAMAGQPWWPEAARATGPGKWHLDLRAAILAQLREAGVAGERIDVVGGCTACRPDLFFSYRRDGATGRMAGYIALAAEARNPRDPVE